MAETARERRLARRLRAMRRGDRVAIAHAGWRTGLCRFVRWYHDGAVMTCSESEWRFGYDGGGVSGVECVVGVVPEPRRGVARG